MKGGSKTNHFEVMQAEKQSRPLWKNPQVGDKIMGSTVLLGVLHLFFFACLQAARAGFILRGFFPCVFKRVRLKAGFWPGGCASQCPCSPAGWGCSSRTFAGGRRWAGLWPAWPVAGSRRPSCHTAAPPAGSTLQQQPNTHQPLPSRSITSHFRSYFLLLLNLPLVTL